ncbi:MAG: TerC family protein [Gammaproteobacteria bacterium]|jgi:predicted tellurium resistance membrane protein TerC
MEWLADPNAWLALVTLTALEIVLGIDNIVFISIVSGNLPPERQPAARRLGLMGAVVTRLVLLASIFWLTRLTRPLFEVLERSISIRDLILIGGGLFLLAKATYEIHSNVEAPAHGAPAVRAASFAAVIVQIMLLDLVFSLDSVITAIGMADQLWVMATAIIIAVGFMLLFVNAISDFVDRHPTLKMLALAFLVLIGVALIAEGLGLHIPKGYIYFAMAFSFGVEMLNMRLRRRLDSREAE